MFYMHMMQNCVFIFARRLSNVRDLVSHLFCMITNWLFDAYDSSCLVKWSLIIGTGVFIVDYRTKVIVWRLSSLLLNVYVSKRSTYLCTYLKS